MLTAALAGCSGGSSYVPSSYTVGGTLAGLGSGQSVTLLDNGGSALTLSTNGNFAFASGVEPGGSYSVTVGTQPTGQVCSVAGGTGAGAGVNANITSVSIICSTASYTIGGTVSGLAGGTTVTLLNNGGASLPVSANGSFTFATPVAYGGSYSVTVSAQPTGQVCSVAGGTGSGAGINANVSSVSITCSTASHTIGGSLSGLANGETFTLLDNGSDALTVTANGAFAFAAPVAYLGSYAVTVSSQPTGQTCSVSGGTGTGSGVTANVTGVSIVCSTFTYSIGGNLSGLLGNNALTLLNNGTDALTLTTNGAITFATPIAYGGSYTVTMSTPPIAQTCSITSGNGSALTAAVNSVAVNCAAPALSTLHSFVGGASDGATPLDSLISDASGNLYGTTYSGGSSNSGTVFKLAPDGSGGYTESVLYNFAGGASGGSPNSTLVLDASGNLYGTTSDYQYGMGWPSSENFGTVFKLTPDGSGGYTQSSLYSFNGGSDAANPLGNLVIDANGNLYGETINGGSTGSGTIFKLAPNGSGGYAENVLYSFPGGASGFFPNGPLTMDGGGNLYGTTQQGGSANLGTVFMLAPNGSGGYTGSILYNFLGAPDAAYPISAGIIMDGNGNLYGTTQSGGSSDRGTAFRLSPTGSGGYTETVLYSFSGGIGDQPNASLIVDPRGNLYGTTSRGGGTNYGTVFMLTPDGSGGYTESVLSSFSGSAGQMPTASLILDASGHLYGTTQAGGASSNGTVFEIH